MNVYLIIIYIANKDIIKIPTEVFFCIKANFNFSLEVWNYTRDRITNAECKLKVRVTCITIEISSAKE